MTYDKSQEYKEEIQPLMDSLKRALVVNHIPFFFAACVKNTENDSEYVKDVYSGLAKGLDLKKDYFPDFIKVTLGFKTTWPSEKMQITPEKENDFISELEALSDND